MIQFTLYHGNTESVINQIIESQSLLDQYKSSGDGHYLGDGYYFYHDEIQAKVWAIMKVKRNEQYQHENWAVLKCTVRLENEKYLDLDLREQQDFFFQEMIRLKLEIEKNQLEILEYNDAFMCNHLSNILELEMLSKTFPYKDKHESYPPFFSNNRSKPYGITRHFRTEKQYCVVNPHIASHFELALRGSNSLNS